MHSSSSRPPSSNDTITVFAVCSLYRIGQKFLFVDKLAARDSNQTIYSEIFESSDLTYHHNTRSHKRLKLSCPRSMPPVSEILAIWEKKSNHLDLRMKLLTLSSSPTCRFMSCSSACGYLISGLQTAWTWFIAQETQCSKSSCLK